MAKAVTAYPPEAVKLPPVSDNLACAPTPRPLAEPLTELLPSKLPPLMPASPPVRKAPQAWPLPDAALTEALPVTVSLPEAWLTP